MKIRGNILPRRILDLVCFLLIGLFLPIVFIFEMIIVLPAFHEPGGFWHTFTFVLAMFLIFNIKTNLIACIMIDTSVNCEKFEAPADVSNSDWRYCEPCEKHVPPRSWHCDVCKVCILKRDHHCLFTACCVGHRNHRYFMVFVVFLFIGSIYALVYNSLYLWVLQAPIFRNWITALKMVCPAVMLVAGGSHDNWYIVFYNLNLLAVLYSVLLMGYHWPIIWRGGVCFERSKGYDYNQGWRKNLASVFGSRMHLVWLCPFIKSPLPDNGIEWTRTKEDKKTQ